MADYVFYRFEINTTGNKRLLDESIPEGTKIDQQWLINLMRDRMRKGAEWQVPNAKGEPRTVEVHYALKNIAILYAYTAQKKEVYERGKEEPKKYTSEPHCTVVLDMRENYFVAAVEKSSFFNSSTENPMYMVLDAIADIVEVIGKVDAHCMYHKGKFWDVVHYRMEVLSDIVRSVTFHFGKDADQAKASEKVRGLMSFCMGQGGGAGEFTRKSVSDTEGMAMRQEDYDELVMLCETNKEYGLSVKFRDCGAYRVGRAARYFYRMPTGTVERFVNGQTSTSEDNNYTWDIVEWLDNLLQREGEYEYKCIQKDYEKGHKKRKAA